MQNKIKTMNESKEITLFWNHYIICDIIEMTICLSLFLTLYFIFNFSPWTLFIPVLLGAGIIYVLSQKKTDVTIDLSGIKIGEKCIKWENIESVGINTIYGSISLELVVVLKNSSFYEVRFFPIPLKNSSLMIDRKIRELSGNSICPKASFWVRYVNYPICRCAISLFHKN